MKRFLSPDEKRMIIYKHIQNGYTASEARQKMEDDCKAISDITKKERVNRMTKRKNTNNDKFLEGLK